MSPVPSLPLSANSFVRKAFPKVKGVRGLICMTAAALSLLLSQSQQATAAEAFITLASTTSTQNSGLFDAILPLFTEQSGVDVRVVAVGTGQAIRLASNCDADVLLVHHRPSEDKFVSDGKGVKRYSVMYNDFVLIGPKDDPAAVSGGRNITDALKKISQAQAPFASRGDDSGTNKKELGLWKDAGLTPQDNSGSWYRETGSGMGATLNIAAGMGAYALTDRATWLAFKNKANLKIVSQGDDRLFNPYGVILVNSIVCPSTKVAEGQAFIDWLVSVDGQSAIGNYRRGGSQLFFPNAGAR
ncbi:substrate-binding domain-containing protein [Rhodovibrionaceae bacterium A322]